MWPTLLTIIALSVTISQGHDGLHDQNIVKTITGQEINTNRVKRFVTGYFVPQNKTNTPRWDNGTYGYNRNTTQQYVNPVQNYNFSKPGYQPYYPNPPGYTQYPANYSVHPAPNPQPNNNKPINPAYPGYPQYPSNYSGYPTPNPQQNNIKPLFPTQPGYSQNPSNYSGYPAPTQQSNNKPFNPSPYPGNYSAYPVPNPQQSNSKPVFPKPSGYSQYPSNYSGYPVPYPQPTYNINPANYSGSPTQLFPSSPGYAQNPSNYSSYPSPSLQPTNKPFNPTQYPGNYSGYPQPSNINPIYPSLPGYAQYPGNYSGYPAPAQQPTNNIPTSSASWLRPSQNNSTVYPVSNTTKPGYDNPAKNNMCGRNDAMHTDACIMTVSGENCPEGTIRFGNYCVDDTDE
ncbi:hypothetical protein HW555_009381 [Spodoptera exigua]|uniref:Uncharacterized protein n=1 Tax=Spodoptera exigua TaxID=7107 RepID=A0A835L6U7_SPOEX|nr:hypothetical protein HW555_009381 [Spodoptera exigua]